MVSTSQNRRHRLFESAGKYKPWCDGVSRWIDTGAALAPSRTAFDYDIQQGQEVFGSLGVKPNACPPGKHRARANLTPSMAVSIAYL
jgi:hypothetical protein